MYDDILVFLSKLVVIIGYVALLVLIPILVYFLIKLVIISIKR